MFPFTISDVRSKNDLRFIRDSIVKIISLSEKEEEQYIIVQLKKELKSRSSTDFLRILRGKYSILHINSVKSDANACMKMFHPST